LQKSARDKFVVGQDVKMRLDIPSVNKSPYIQAHIYFISPLVSDSFFINAEFRNQVIAPYLDELKSKNTKPVKVVIITKDARLAERLFRKIRKPV
jgi:hypothetical protein